LSSSGQGDTYILPKKQKLFKCSIGRSVKGEDAALLTLGSIGIPLAIVGILGSSVGGNLTGIVQAIGDAIISAINAIGGIGGREGITGDLTAKHGKLAVDLARILSPYLFKGMMRNGLSWVGRRLTRGQPSIPSDDIAEPDPRPISIPATLDAKEPPPQHPTPTPIPLKFLDIRTADKENSGQSKARKTRGEYHPSSGPYLSSDNWMGH
jgi:hypothetical protein